MDSSSMRKSFHDLLVVPPPIRTMDEPFPLLESILLDPYGYLSAEENASTAEGLTSRDNRILVTFWVDHPPRISCFTVHCDGVLASKFGDFPKILCTEDDLVLLRVAICPRREAVFHGSNDYFVYQARSKNKPPSLQLIPMPPDLLEFSDREAALLRCRARDMFFVAVLRRRFASNRGQYNLHVYRSDTNGWSTKLMYAPQNSAFLCTSKVITIGGELGSVGWVDLWRGMLICDMLLDSNKFRYISLPLPRVPKLLKGNPLFSRDIAVVKGYLKYIDMNLYIKPGSITEYDNFTPDGWDAATWKMDLSKEDSNWEDDCKIKTSEVPVNDLAYAQMLPKLQVGEDTESMLMRLHAGYPTLSLHEDDVVHIMNKVEIDEDLVWVFSIDMRRYTLKGLARFCSGRPVGHNFIFLESGISKHLGIWSSNSHTLPEARNPANATGTSRSGMEQSGKQVLLKEVQPQPNSKIERTRGIKLWGQDKGKKNTYCHGARMAKGRVD